MRRLTKTIVTLVLMFTIILSNGLPVSASEDMTPSGIPVSKLEGTIDTYISDYIEKSNMGAAIIYINNGQIAFSKGYGYADVKNKIKVDPEKTVFEYASISKTFTWTAIMQMVEQGKINLNDDISTYLPKDFMLQLQKKLKYDKAIRVIDLMNHRAGFEDRYFSTDVTRQEDLSDSLKEALLVAMPQQVYEPDTVTSYSNYGAALAGYIVECITGQKLYDYLEEHVFGVLDMETATANPRYDDISYIKDNKAIGYGEGFSDNGWAYVNTYPDGSINGTALDLAKYAKGYMQKDCPVFEHQQTKQDLFATSHKATEYITGCAHGFWEYDGAEKFYMHDGAQRGFVAICAFSKDSKDGLIVLSNNGSQVNMIYELLQLIMGDGTKIQVEPGKNLPSAYALDGMEFLDARRNYSDVTSFYSYLEGNTKVRTIDDQTIEYNGLTYVQTAPYFYELTDDKDNLIVKCVYSKINFLIQDGEITGLNMGGIAGGDYLRCEFPNTNVGLILQAAFFLLSFFTFLIAPFIYVIKAVYRKKKGIQFTEAENKYHHFIISIGICGLLLSINFFVLVVGMLSMVEFGPTLQINLQLGINYILTILFVVLFYFRMQFAIKNKDKIFYKKRHVLYVIAFLIMVVLFVKWNYFSLI